MLLHIKISGTALITLGLIGLHSAERLYYTQNATNLSELGNLVYLVQGRSVIIILNLLWQIGSAVLALPALVGGLGLLVHRGWGRTIGILVSAVFLLLAPVGTLVGAYCLWVLLSADSDMIFEGRFGDHPEQIQSGWSWPW